MKSFRNKVVAITGAGSGIGRALGLEFARAGARLALSDRNLADVEASAAACREAGAEARAYAVDVASKDAVYAHSAAVKSDFGVINAIINNAGVSLTATVKDMTWEDFEWVMNIDFWGVAYGTKAFLPHLIESGEGHVVNVSSVFGLVAVPTQSAYNAAKFAVRGFTDALHEEMRYAKTNVDVTVVHPGGVRTNIATNARASSERARAISEKAIKHGFTTPEGAARIIFAGMCERKRRILVGPDAYLLDGLQRVSATRYQGMMAGAMHLMSRFRGV